MISSPNRSRRSGKPVRLVCIHTAEGARTVAGLGNYFSRTSTQASSHVGIDDNAVEQYVPYSESAWTLRSGNSISDNAELCGFAAWTRDEWLNHHRGMLDRAADWIALRCRARGIPIRKLTPEQVRRGEAGVIGHHDWTVGMRDGTHTDPGNGFPWDYVIARAAGHTEEDELSKQEVDQLRRDIGWARDQIMTHLGKRPDMAPLPAPQLAGVEVARRVDVGYARDQLAAELAMVKHEQEEQRELIEAIAEKLGIPLTESS